MKIVSSLSAEQESLLSIGQTGLVVSEQAFESVDAYGMIDIEGAPVAVGPVRSAKKVLQRTTIDLIRHATYSLAIHHIDGAGGAAALNHDRGADDQSPIESFATELSTWADTARFVATTGLGLGATEIGSTLHASAAWSTELVASSAAACVPIGASSVVIASDGEEPALRATLASRDVTLESDLAAAISSGVDVVIVRAKAGALHHESLADVNVGQIIALQPLTTTARGLAVAGRQGTVIVPDFISSAGPYLAALGTSDELEPVTQDIASATSSVLTRLADTGTDMFVRACELAEAHLRTWTSDLPFGRPLAP